MGRTDTHSLSNKTGSNMRSFKNNGVKNEVKVKKLGEEYDFSLCPLAQLLT